MSRQCSRAAIVTALVLLVGCGSDHGRGSGPDGGRPVTTTTTTEAALPGGSGTSTVSDPCTTLTLRDIRARTVVAYDQGTVLHQPEATACVYRRTEGTGDITVTLFTQEQLDRDLRQDPNLAYHDLRGLLEHTKEVAMADSSTYVRSTDLDLPGYEIVSSDPSETDRLAVLAGDNLVVIAVSDPTITIDTVRGWMRLVLGRL